MCDTMVALGNATKNGSVIFAKNSDRQPNEPHIMIRVSRKKYDKGKRLKCTYIEIEQAEETYEVLLLKPSWIWGCEMGSNEFGLTIGNEAVFTKKKVESIGLLGMDMVRIALERCKTSDEGLDMLINLIEKYGQGGNCGYEKKFTYHNSFLIADRNSAWVLETAGKYWSAEKVIDIRSISNCLTIGKNYDRCHPELITHAIDKGWCKGEEDFNFSKCYTSPLVTRLSEANKRHETTTMFLEEEKGSITIGTMKSILRYHSEDIESNEFNKHSLKSICMHGGFIYGDHTTGSYIASLSENIDTYWVTGSSTPCISTFKPFWFIEGEKLTYNEKDTEKAITYWKLRESLHRMFIENKILDINTYLIRRNELEKNIDEDVKMINLKNINSIDLLEIMNYAIEEETNLIINTIKENESNKGEIKGSLYFKYYWKKKSHKLFHDIS